MLIILFCLFLFQSIYLREFNIDYLNVGYIKIPLDTFFEKTTTDDAEETL